MKIRYATNKDALPLMEMTKNFFDSSQTKELNLRYEPISAAETLSSLISSDDGVVIIGEDDEGVHGMLLGTLLPWMGDLKQNLAQEVAWWVNPEARGNGTAVGMLKAFTQWAKDKGASSVIMGSINHLDGAKVNKLYTHFGFKPYQSTFIKPL